MKTVISHGYDTIELGPHGAERVSDRPSTSPIGLFGHLRKALDAWRAEREKQKSIKEILALDPATLRDITTMTPAEMYESQQKRAGQFPHPGDVLSGPLMHWPTPSDRH